MCDKILNNLFYLVWLLIVAGLGMMRSSPLYGKIDFFLIDGRPWWPKWESLIQETRRMKNSIVYTDYITGYILAGVFGKQTILDADAVEIPKLFIDDMEENKITEGLLLSIYFPRFGIHGNFNCIVNLMGYQSSWVPHETRHWSSLLSDTSRLYQFKNAEKSLDIVTELEHFPLKKCIVYFPQKR